MPESAQRPIPLLGDIALEYVQRIEHRLDGGFLATPIAGLAGELQQRLARPSHRIALSGILIGTEVAEQIATLQDAAAQGAELTFAADITTALDINTVVIDSFRVVEEAAVPGRYLYEMVLVESPPLPPPATVSAFGGLDDFGLGDLGFDTDIMGGLTDLAGELAGALNDALGVLDALDALAGLDGLSVGGLLQPLQDVADNLAPVADTFGNALDSLGDLLG